MTCTCVVRLQLTPAQLQANWELSPAVALLIESRCYQEIAAPRGIAPPTKKPFSLPSEMMAHHSVNFAKVYGKYLLSQCHRADTLRVSCLLLDILSLCLASSVTPTLIGHLEGKIKIFAHRFRDWMPTVSKALVLHTLIFHMPATIAYWGPARGYWCFPFERSVRLVRIGRNCPNRTDSRPNAVS